MRTQLEAQFIRALPGQTMRPAERSLRWSMRIAATWRQAILGKKHFEMATELDRDYQDGFVGHAGLDWTACRGRLTEERSMNWRCALKRGSFFRGHRSCRQLSRCRGQAFASDEIDIDRCFQAFGL